MNYQETLDYLFSQLPMYQRLGKAAYKSDLSNTVQLCKILGNPENKFKSVHVAGTNGKGSTSHMLASIFHEEGYKVGLYTSPHLKDFRERIKINGEMISEEAVVSFVNEYKNEFEKINLSFFEWTVGLAFYYFASKNVDIAIVETGLGGRLDSTNVIFPEVSVITNIGKDHTQFLGETLPLIAREKAGIIKQNTPVIIGETQENIKNVFEEIALQNNALIYFADKEITKQYTSDLKGIYQQKNIKTVLMTCEVLISKGWELSENNIKKGLLNTITNTNLLGRWQILNHNPLIVCDTGHNESGISEIINQIQSIKYSSLHIVMGFVNDKSIESVLKLFPKNAHYYFCKANIQRALDATQLKEMAQSQGLNGDSYGSVNAALNAAKLNAQLKDFIFVGGSTFVVAEVL